MKECPVCKGELKYVDIRYKNSFFINLFNPPANGKEGYNCKTCNFSTVKDYWINRSIAGE